MINEKPFEWTFSEGKLSYKVGILIAITKKPTQLGTAIHQIFEDMYIITTKILQR